MADYQTDRDTIVDAMRTLLEPEDDPGTRMVFDIEGHRIRVTIEVLE